MLNRRKEEEISKLQFNFSIQSFFLLFRHFNRHRKDQRLFAVFFPVFKELCFDYKFAIKNSKVFVFVQFLLFKNQQLRARKE
jgi:hypothetical protein